MTWKVDFTTAARSDLVGLELEVNETLLDQLIDWISDGPPRENGRSLVGVEFYEEIVSDRYLIAYSVDEPGKRFVILWFRLRPGDTSLD